LGHSFIKKKQKQKQLLSDSVTSAVLDMGETVVSHADSVSEFKEPAAMEKPLGKKSGTRHDENYKR